MIFLRHRHKWEEYEMIGNQGKTIFYCRKCKCGADEIKNAGPMGDGKWQGREIKTRQSFEQEWIDNAVLSDPGRRLLE